MTAPLLLLAFALAAGQGSDPCHVVGNEGIVTIPCDSSRSAVAAAEARAQGAPQPAAQGAGTEARPQGAGARAEGAGAGKGVTAQGTGATPAGASAEEQGAAAFQERGEAVPAPSAAATTNGSRMLQQEVERLQQERQAAEAERARAERDRQAAVDELAGIRQELAAARQRTEQAEQARTAQLADLDSTASALADADGVLATGSAGDAEEVLARAGEVLGSAHSRDGSAWVAAAQDALSRSDYAAARRAIQYAARAAAQAQPAGAP